MTHLAIGDFTFQGVYLQALKKKYPQIKLDIWIDDCRESSKDWHKGRNNALGQWLRGLSFIDDLYPIALSNDERTQLIKRAADEDYDIIVFIASQRCELYAKYARQISQRALIVGSRAKKLSSLIKKAYYFSKLDGEFDLDKLEQEQDLHISEIYERRFEKCFGDLDRDDQAAPILPIKIGEDFRDNACRTLATWSKTRALDKPEFVFINHLSTTPKRDYSWPKLAAVIRGIHEAHPAVAFVLNVPPNAFSQIEQQLGNDESLNDIPVFLFTAANHFLELPALIEACSFVISVETATMHLAAALRKPQIALIRKKAQSWRPTYAEAVICGDRKVDDVSPLKVVEAFSKMYLDHQNKSDLYRPSKEIG